jgi:hypothetical protein
MTTLTKVILDCSTGISTEVPLTAEELAEHAEQAKQAEANRLARKEAETALAALKASAKAKLITGKPLTAEEADTLVI